MRKYEEAPRVRFSREEKQPEPNVPRGNYFFSLLKVVSEETLFKSMYKSAEAENYEIATLYRDELIRRGKLSQAV